MTFNKTTKQKQLIVKYELLREESERLNRAFDILFEENIKNDE